MDTQVSKQASKQSDKQANIQANKQSDKQHEMPGNTPASKPIEMGFKIPMLVSLPEVGQADGTSHPRANSRETDLAI